MVPRWPPDGGENRHGPLLTPPCSVLIKSRQYAELCHARAMRAARGQCAGRARVVLSPPLSPPPMPLPPLLLLLLLWRSCNAVSRRFSPS